MMLGTAAMRSMADTMEDRRRRGAYSVMNRAKPMANGTLTVTATRAISTVPTRTAAMPIWLSSGCHDEVVKKLKP